MIDRLVVDEKLRLEGMQREGGRETERERERQRERRIGRDRERWGSKQRDEDLALEKVEYEWKSE